MVGLWSLLMAAAGGLGVKRNGVAYTTSDQFQKIKAKRRLGRFARRTKAPHNARKAKARRQMAHESRRRNRTA